MAYTPNKWVDREGITRYFESVDDDGALILTPDYTQVTEMGTPVNADNMNHIEEGIGDHENRITVLENLPDKYLNKAQITNCLLEVPQRIKYELVEGTLTIKAGSVVIVPYGTEDLTETYPVGSTFLNDNFKVYDTQYAGGKFFVWAELQNDISVKPNITGNIFISVRLNGVQLDYRKAELCYSGSSDAGTSDTSYYNTTINIFTSHNASGDVQNAFPSFVTSATPDGVTSVNQVFNGMGYIGSIVWVDKGVKGLIPDGRNEDGSLKNIEFITDKITTVQASESIKWFGIKLEDGILKAGVYGDYLYDEKTNTVHIENNVYTWMYAGILTCSNGQIIYFNSKPAFKVVDYSDKPIIAGWCMPSNKYIDLTLGASGSTYIAPANGWFNSVQNLSAGSDTNWTNGVVQIGQRDSNGVARILVPVKKGDSYRFYYTGLNQTYHFRFIYAVGSESEVQ